MAATGLILTVCTANICRSPMAAALLRHALAAEPEPLHSLEVASAGIAARSGQPVSANSVSTLRKAGIDIADHRSQPVTQALLDRALLVLCMTESHRAMIALSFRPVPPRLHLFREFMPEISRARPAPDTSQRCGSRNNSRHRAKPAKESCCRVSAFALACPIPARQRTRNRPCR
jgi:protein-tyrosine-phosphatase